MSNGNFQADDVTEQPLVSDEAVARYLDGHPDFFRGREGLLTRLSLPHQSGQSVSLVERQIAVLRERNTELRHRLDQLIRVASSNDLLFNKCRTLTISLIESTEATDFCAYLENSLLAEFNCIAARLVLTRPVATVHHPFLLLTTSDALVSAIPGIAQSLKPVLGAMRPQELAYFFGSRANMVQSAAAIPLIDDDLVGILAIGHPEPSHFSVDLDTMFLDFIAEIIMRLLPRLEPNPG